MQLVRYILL